MSADGSVREEESLPDLLVFWINVPVAIIALVLIWRARITNERQPAKIDYRGTVLIIGAMGLIVLALQQSTTWGWSSVTTWACIAAGVLLMAAFIRWELRTPDPLLRLQIFRNRAFAVDTAALALMSVVFVPFFFFASVYAQVSLGETASKAGLYILYFFLGFVIMAQIGGRILDRRGARPALVYGGALGAVGFYLLAGRLTHLSLSSQRVYVMLAGGGLGLILGTASTDAVNRAPRTSYSEVTGITQTARNFGASLGLAVLGAVLVSRNETNISGVLTKAGVPRVAAHKVAASFGSAAGQSGAGHSHALVRGVELAFAHSTQTVFYIMAAVMAAISVLSLRGLPRGGAALARDAEAVDAADQGGLAVADPVGERA